VKDKVWLRGQGMYGTYVQANTGHNDNMFETYESSNGTSDPNAFFCAIMDMTIDGRKALQSSGDGHGIMIQTNPLTTAASGDPFFDPIHLIQNVRCYTCRGDGVFINGRSGVRLINVWARSCDGYGFNPSFDTDFMTCLAEGNALGGFYINNSSVRITNSKSYLNANAGFHIQNTGGGVNISGCEAQNNQGAGFKIEDSARCILTGCVADSNNTAETANVSGFELDNAHFCIITGISAELPQGGVQIGDQVNGVRLIGAANNNDITITHSAQAPATTGDGLSADSTLLANRVYINGVQET
jgi:parallel beta-helix repeat protein